MDEQRTVSVTVLHAVCHYKMATSNGSRNGGSKSPFRGDIEYPFRKEAVISIRKDAKVFQ